MRLLLLGVLSFVVVVILYRGGQTDERPWKAALRWALRDGVHLSLLSSIIVLALLSLTHLWIKSPLRLAAVSLSLAGAMCLANVLKIQHTRVPVLPHELELLRHVNLIFAYVPRWFWFAVAAAIALVVGFAVLRRKSDRRPAHVGLGWRLTLLSAAPGLVLGVLVFRGVNLPIPTRHLTIHTLHNESWDPLHNLRRNGPVLVWLMSTGVLRWVPPTDYRREAISEALKEVPAATPPAAAEAAERPDIVVLMVESWFDPTRLPDVTFSPDPMPHLRAMMEQHPSGNVYVPVFGGGTANSEFEFLTGLSTAYMPTGTIAYVHYVNRQTRSLASIMRDAGYATTAVHNFDRSFWRRDQVYPLLGFDRFFGLEDLGEVTKLDWRPEDVMLEAKVLELLRQPADAPQFIFGVTMATHGPYDHEPVRNEPMEVEAPTLDRRGDTRSKNILRNYALALRSVDRVIQTVAEEVMRREKPTLLLVFGDHLPSMEDVYHSCGAVSTPAVAEWSEAELDWAKQTPWVLVSNRPIERRSHTQFSLNCLGNELLQTLQMPLQNRVQDYLTSFCQQQPHLTKRHVTDGSKLVSNYGLLVYDELVGERFLDEPAN